MNITDLSSEQLRQAASLKEQITALEKQLQGLLGGGSVAPSKAVKVTKGGLTEAGRARLSEVAKARWAKIKASKGNATKLTSSSGKKTMSPAAKAKISAAAKARWAKIKAGK